MHIHRQSHHHLIASSKISKNRRNPSLLLVHLLLETAKLSQNKPTKTKTNIYIYVMFHSFIYIATTIAEQLSGLGNTSEKGSKDNFNIETSVCCCLPFPVQCCRQLHSISSSPKFISDLLPTSTLNHSITRYPTVQRTNMNKPPKKGAAAREKACRRGTHVLSAQVAKRLHLDDFMIHFCL